MLQTTLATGAILLLISAGLLPAHVQKKQRVITGDDPHGLKVFGMPRANRKYRITDLPSTVEVPAEYGTCGKGVYYQKEKVRGVDVTAVIVHFPAEGDYELNDDDPPKLSNPGYKSGFESYLPPDWVALTFTLLRDSFTLQEIRVARVFPRPAISGTNGQWSSGLVDGKQVRVDRSWVDNDPCVTWEVLPESQLSFLIFRIRLPKSTKDCLENKK